MTSPTNEPAPSDAAAPSSPPVPAPLPDATAVEGPPRPVTGAPLAPGTPATAAPPPSSATTPPPSSEPTPATAPPPAAGTPPPPPPPPPRSDPPPPSAAGTSSEPREPSLTDAPGQLAATLKLGLEIFPRPTEGIVRYARSRPWSTSLAIVATSTILFPLTKWLAVEAGTIKTFVSGLLAALLAHAVLGLVLVAGLRVHFGRKIDARELLGTFAASQLPFIPALLVGWMLTFVKQGPDLYLAMQTIGLILAALYLSTALRELYQLGADGALYFASVCYGAWLIVFSAGIR